MKFTRIVRIIETRLCLGRQRVSFRSTPAYENGTQHTQRTEVSNNEKCLYMLITFLTQED